MAGDLISKENADKIKDFIEKNKKKRKEEKNKKEGNKIIITLPRKQEIPQTPRSRQDVNERLDKKAMPTLPREPKRMPLNPQLQPKFERMPGDPNSGSTYQLLNKGGRAGYKNGGKGICIKGINKNAYGKNS